VFSIPVNTVIFQRTKRMSSQFGTVFRVSTFGESHGQAVGCVIDGCPANFELSIPELEKALFYRKPGQSELTTPRNEADVPVILSGINSENITLGSPICCLVYNKNQNKSHYQDIAHIYRPSHADLTTELKYGLREVAGGGRSSARETVGRVIAGNIAEQILRSVLPNYEAVCWVSSVANIHAEIDTTIVKQADIFENNNHFISKTRCPNKEISEKIYQKILEVKAAGDSVGGTISCVVRGVPAGLGEPVFDKLNAKLGHALLSLPATKGIEFGSGFKSTLQLGSKHNDAFIMEGHEIKTRTNNSGGIQGGISNGMPIQLTVAFKPVSTIFKEQNTVNKKEEEIIFKPKQGRHDPCVLPRAVSIVQAMVNITIVDFYLRQKLQIFKKLGE
jgi:chorismate synthase